MNNGINNNTNANTNNNTPNFNNTNNVPTNQNNVNGSMNLVNNINAGVNNTQSMPHLVDPTKMDGIDNIHISSSPVNNPTAELKNVNAGTISTGNTGNPRINDTSVIKQDDAMPKTTISNGEPGSFKSKMEEAQKNYKAPSKFKTFLAVLFLIFLLAFIIFLPEVSEFMDGMFGGKNNDVSNSEPTTGVMECTYSESGMNLDINYVRSFKYVDNKLNSVILETTTRGDVSEDAKTLDDYNNSCVRLKNDLSSMNGITISCNYSEGKLVRRENIDLEEYNEEQVEHFYAEEGLELISYKKGEDINDIKTSMVQNGFSCTKKA